ncbi:MAG: hypothetical protein EZS28_048000, partial [Streblomastix strix]
MFQLQDAVYLFQDVVILHHEVLIRYEELALNCGYYQLYEELAFNCGYYQLERRWGLSVLGCCNLASRCSKFKDSVYLFQDVVILHHEVLIRPFTYNLTEKSS